MTEKQLRALIVNIAESFLGCNEADGSHKKIIDIYNKHTPRARGYKVKYTDAWCSTFASAVAIEAGLTDIIPTECGCENHIKLFKGKNIWVENDAYKPKIGDFIFYDWDDTGSGDNTGHSDHVGIVVSVTGNKIKVIEGNMSNKVGYRELAVNAKGIRGYGVPKYIDKATEGDDAVPAVDSYKVGDTVNFTGCLHYNSSFSSAIARGCRAGLAKITAVSTGKPYPYHLKAIVGKGSTVYGWVKEADIAGVITGKRHTVGAGETLTKIAKKYGTTVEALVRLNGIKDKNIIRIGQVIYIP